jgi:hypothetical protein
VNKKSIGEYSVEKRISRISVKLKLEESVGAKYSVSQLKLEVSIKEVYSEVREICSVNLLVGVNKAVC